MSKEWIASIGGQQREIVVAVVADDDGRFRVRVGDSERRVDAVEVRDGLWSVIIDGQVHLIELDVRGDQVVALGSEFESPIGLEDARKKRLAETVGASSNVESSGEKLRAPIAGKVVKYYVDVGDTVEAGQSVVVLEAMKMENEIKATRGGVVESVHVEVGQSVDTRELLVTLV